MDPPLPLTPTIRWSWGAVESRKRVLRSCVRSSAVTTRTEIHFPWRSALFPASPVESGIQRGKMRIADLIIKKRDGHELTDDEIRFFVDELVKGRVEGSQVGK